MSASLVFFIAFLAAAGAFAVAARFLLFSRSPKERLVAEAKRLGCVTVGTVCGSWRDHANGPGRVENWPAGWNAAAVEYEYFVDGVRYTSNQWFEDAATTVKYPMQVAVFYDPSDPSRCVLDCEDLVGQRGKRGCFLTFAVAVLAFIVVANSLGAITGADLLEASYG